MKFKVTLSFKSDSRRSFLGGQKLSRDGDRPSRRCRLCRKERIMFVFRKNYRGDSQLLCECCSSSAHKKKLAHLIQTHQKMEGTMMEEIDNHKSQEVEGIRQTNQEGIVAFHCGDVNRAALHFQNALQACRNVFQVVRPAGQNSSSYGPAACHDGERYRGRSKAFSTVFGERTCPDEIIHCADLKIENEREVAKASALGNWNLFFYGMLPNASIAECALRSMFNLATCHIWKSIQLSSHQDLIIAKRLCELAYEMQVGEDFQIVIPSLFLATVDHLAKIQRILGDRKSSDHCFKNLLSALIFFTAPGQASLSSPLDPKLHEAFVASTEHLILKEQISASAA